MEWLVAVGLICSLVFVESRICKNEHDCEKNECCAALSVFQIPRMGICLDLSIEGQYCSEEETKLNYFGGKYILRCPCREGLDCKSRAYLQYEDIHPTLFDDRRYFPNLRCHVSKEASLPQQNPNEPQGTVHPDLEENTEVAVNTERSETTSDELEQHETSQMLDRYEVTVSGGPENTEDQPDSERNIEAAENAEHFYTSDELQQDETNQELERSEGTGEESKSSEETGTKFGHSAITGVKFDGTEETDRHFESDDKIGMDYNPDENSEETGEQPERYRRNDTDYSPHEDIEDTGGHFEHNERTSMGEYLHEALRKVLEHLEKAHKVLEQNKDARELEHDEDAGEASERNETVNMQFTPNGGMEREYGYLVETRQQYDQRRRMSKDHKFPKKLNKEHDPNETRSREFGDVIEQKREPDRFDEVIKRSGSDKVTRMDEHGKATNEENEESSEEEQYDKISEPLDYPQYEPKGEEHGTDDTSGKEIEYHATTNEEFEYGEATEKEFDWEEGTGTDYEHHQATEIRGVVSPAHVNQESTSEEIRPHKVVSKKLDDSLNPIVVSDEESSEKRQPSIKGQFHPNYTFYIVGEENSRNELDIYVMT